jgi:hypothetical protein
MYQIALKNKTITLTARARYYREFKMALGVQNLKNAFFAAYENIDVDFLAAWIKYFADDRDLELGEAYDILDEMVEDGRKLYDIYADAADFLNGMGFFGKLEVGSKRTIAYFEDKMNKIDIDSKVASAIDTAVSEYTTQAVTEQMKKDESKSRKK